MTIKALTIFSLSKVVHLEKVVEDFQKNFDILLEDTFSEDELESFEKQIDTIGALYVQPIMSELTFEDFNAGTDEEKKKFFFESCQSSILIENLPYLESNPFQVSYLLELLKRFENVLIDRGGMFDLMFKDEFVHSLKPYKVMDSLIQTFVPKKEIKTFRPVDPIDFLVLDVYREIDRLKDVVIKNEELPEKLVKLLYVMRQNHLDPASLYVKSGLNAKDFDDGLERLKFFLRKL